MRRSGFGWWRLAKQVVFGVAESVASFANTTLTAASATGTADGSTANTLTLTLRDTSNTLMPSKAVTFTTELTAVDADETTLVDDAAEIETTTGTLNLTLTIRNADGTPLPNIQSARIVYASTGSNNTFGTPTVTDRHGQSLCTFSSTTAEAKTISVTVDGVAITQTAAVTVTGTPGLHSPEFLSFFSNGTGTGDTAITDGDVWADPPNNFSPGGQGLEVIASAGLDFPSTNVLRVTAVDATDGYAWLRTNQMATVPNGGTRNFRFYIRVMLPDDLVDFEQHPIQDGNAAGDSNWMFKVMTPSTLDGEWYPRIHAQGGANFRFEGPTLTKDTVTYRFECQVYRIDSTTFRFHCSIYDTSDTLLFTDADFESDAPGTNPLSDDPTLTIVNAASFVGLNAGSNGITDTGSPPWPFVQSYQGCFAVVDGLAEGAIIGPFGSVTGEA